MKIIIYSFIFIFLTLPGIGFICQAQNSNIQFEHITIENGLSHNYVMDVIQDRKGYIWFGTATGLNKFDGYRFTNYKFNPYDSSTLSQNQIMKLWEDKDGTIWIGTSEGSSKFNPKTETFKRMGRSEKNPYAFTFVQSFNEDQDGNIWVGGSFEGELRQINKKTGKFSKINYASMLESGIPDNTENPRKLHLIFKDKAGTLWIGSPSGLHKLNLPSAKNNTNSKVSFTHYSPKPVLENGLGSIGILGIHEDRKGVFWVITQNGELYSFDKKQGKFKLLQTYPSKSLSVHKLFGCRISEDHEGKLWIGTLNGLWKLNNERTTLNQYLSDPSDLLSLSNNLVFSVLVDKSGILWATTMDGVNKLDPHRKPFLLHRKNLAAQNYLSGNKITALHEDQEGILWIGTIGGGLNAYDKKAGEYIHYRHDPHDPQSLRSDNTSAVIEDKDGKLWVGNGDVLSRLDRNNGKFIHYNLDHPFVVGHAASAIFTIFEDKAGIFWLGTNNGIVKFDPKTGNIISYSYDSNFPDRISDWWALAILEDKKGNLWIGPGSQALMKFDRKSETFTQYKHDINNPGSISSNTIPDIFEDSKGNLWFGTGDGGLCLFDHEKDSFTCYTEKQGLAGNSVFSILEDDEGDLWLGTNNGLSRFSPENKTFTNYDADDGLQSKLFTSMYTEAAACKGKDGMLYFGGNNGLNAFHPASINLNTYVPPVVISGFRLFDKPMPGLHEAGEIVLNYNENFFSLEFAALNFTNTHKNQYVYQLEGVDDSWINAGTRNFASYTGVSPGKYTFRVKGSNNDGVWNEEAVSFSIIIRPPFWKTWWAYLIYASLFLSALLFLAKEIKRKEQLKSNLKIKNLESEKLLEMDKMKSQFFTNISHEFRTPLSLIQGTVEKLEIVDNSPVRLPDYHVIYRNTSRLLQLINQVLDLSKLEAGKLMINSQPGELLSFLKILFDSFTSLFESKKINYQYQLPNEKLYVIYDADKIEKILSNLLANAFKFTPPQGKVFLIVKILEIDLNRCKLQIIIQDTGIGIPEQQLSRIFDRFHQLDTSTTRPNEGTGVGLALVKELVELFGGEIKVESTKGSGATFNLLLPLILSNEQDYISAGQEQKEAPVHTYLEEENGTASSSDNRSTTSKTCKVLIVEDNGELRNFISGQLSQYRMYESENGSQGFSKALEIIPDLVISDAMMPEMDGFQLCEKLKNDERTSHIPLILLTAKADLESKLQGLKMGADDYLTKPFKLEELQLRIRNLLESRKKLRELFNRKVELNPKEVTVTSVDERFLQKAISIMEANMANAAFDVKAFSKEIGISRAQFHRKLTALSGLSANEFIRSFRLKRAASLLRQQQGNVSEIAFQVGFNSLNYFTKCFRDYYGQTPTEYAKNPISTE